MITDIYCEHSINDYPKKGKFYLHNHDDSFEILLFIRGNAKFTVEGTVYKMEPYDMVIAQSYEMHRMVVEPDCIYERMVIDIKNSFFIRNDCEKYKSFFTQRKLGENNQIKSGIVLANGIDKMIYSLNDYYHDKSDNMTAANAAGIELLYTLNKVWKKSEEPDSHDERVRDIIIFINRHITENLNLDEIASKFYITKCHLCRMFKKYTGYTVNNYIIYKRVLFAKELYREGKSWMQASGDAGFGDYANFYKHFKQIYGYSPRELE